MKLNLIDENSIIIIETDDERIINELEKIKIKIIGKRKYGRAYLVFLQRA